MALFLEYYRTMDGFVLVIIQNNRWHFLVIPQNNRWLFPCYTTEQWIAFFLLYYRTMDGFVFVYVFHVPSEIIMGNIIICTSKKLLP